MTNNQELNKAQTFIFFPAALLSLLLFSSSAIFFYIRTAILSPQMGVQPTDLNTPMIVAQSVLVLSLLLFSIFKPIETVFRWAFGVFIVLLALLAGSVYLEAFSDSSLLYVFLSLFDFTLFSLFVWGFINRFTSASLGKWFILLAFVLEMIGGFLYNFALYFLRSAISTLFPLLLTAIGLMVVAFVVFQWAWKRQPEDLLHPDEASTSSMGRFPYLSVAYFLAGAVIVKKLLTILFATQLKEQFPDANAHLETFGSFLTTNGVTAMVAPIFWAAIGTWLILKKGWRATALTGSIFLLLAGLAFFFVPQASWLMQGMLNGVLTGTTVALFFPLVQMLYLYLPSQTRFQTKIAAEMILLPLMKSTPGFITGWSITLFGSLLAAALPIKILSLFLLVLLVGASWRLSNKLTASKA